LTFGAGGIGAAVGGAGFAGECGFRESPQWDAIDLQKMTRDATVAELHKKAQEQAWSLKDYGESKLLKTFQEEALKKMMIETPKFIIQADPNMKFVISVPNMWVTDRIRPQLSHRQRILLLTENPLT
jgi:hypothetical protein